MNQLGPFLVLIGVAAVALAALGGVVGWYNEEGRLIRRSLRKVLKGETHALIVAPGRGRGAGFNFNSNMMAVAWDTGAWCLIYRLEELLGLELVIDGQVVGRAFRGESRRAVDVMGGADKQVSLRLVFDDPQHADFVLELWSAARAPRRPAMDADQAVQEGNRWLARIESIFRRQSGARVAPRPAPAEPAPTPAPPAPAPRPQAAPPPAVEAAPEPPHAPRPVEAAEPPAPAPPAAPAPAAAVAHQELPFNQDPPWDEDADDEALL